ncbi:response regulator [Candidatus Sumerlaeota bacterium]|nr:response regulator [Candidatus Sumerlaeota bacterium]
MALRILIVDDSLSIRQVVKKVMGQAGLDPNQCVEACDGREALDRLERDRFDLIVADLNMPRMDGLQMIRHIRETPATRAVPVIVLSAEGNDDTIRLAMEAGANGYVLKPFTPEVLASQIRPLGLTAEADTKTETDDTDPSDPQVF